MIPKGTRPEVVHATINSSCLWRFCEVLTLTKNIRILHGASESNIEERKQFSDWVVVSVMVQLGKSMMWISLLVYHLTYFL